MKTVEKILTGLVIALIIVVGALTFVLVRQLTKNKETINLSKLYEKQIQEKDSLIKISLYQVDSLKLLQSSLIVSNEVIQKKYEKVKDQYKIIVVNYRKLKPDIRAEIFLSATQKEPVSGTIFYNDSLLVPMHNIDSANIAMYDCELCDTVIKIKDEDIDNLRMQVSTLDEVIREMKSAYENEAQVRTMLEERVDMYAIQAEQKERKLKWTKIKGIVKDVAILVGIGYIILK